ncbi:hypothetical protein ANO11243_019830 [Dothideomycetidae sp. 11243]|nr:hypothetical protein ANO11243_019830 [fungal sp. No.11243]
MALPRTSLRGFLTHAKYTLQVAALSKSPVTFVVGNESADLDSICSTILYSYIASISPRSSRTSQVFHIPLLNLPKADIGLRPELLALLPKANITRDHLITLDDLGDANSLDARFSPANTRWILVDHNSLQGRLGQLYGDRVVGTIDHHVDEGTVLQDTQDEPRVITTCGSCTSLVANYLQHSWDLWSLYVSFSGAANGQGDNIIEDGAFATLWDAQVAQFALGAILIDTVNLNDEHKTAQQDREAAKYLEARIKMSPKIGKSYDRAALYDEIARAKQSLDNLTVRDILRKDYKQWTENSLSLGISSVVKPYSYLETKAQDQGNGDLLIESQQFVEDKKLDITSVLTAFTSTDGTFQRELSLLSRDERGKQVIERFCSDASKQLRLSGERRRESQDWLHVIWNQGDLAASRKQVAPLLRKAMAAIQ